jgi:hypothetical protein
MTNWINPHYGNQSDGLFSNFECLNYLDYAKTHKSRRTNFQKSANQGVCTAGGLHSRGLYSRGSVQQGVCIAWGLYSRGSVQQGVCTAGGLYSRGSVQQGVCRAVLPIKAIGWHASFIPSRFLNFSPVCDRHSSTKVCSRRTSREKSSAKTPNSCDHRKGKIGDCPPSLQSRPQGAHRRLEKA